MSKDKAITKTVKVTNPAKSIENPVKPLKSTPKLQVTQRIQTAHSWKREVQAKHKKNNKSVKAE